MNYLKISLLGLAAALVSVTSCSHPSGTGTGSGGTTGTGGSGNCPAGSVGCPCNGTSCDQGLNCANVGGTEMQCVATSTGTGGSGTGGATGTGGSVATGGATGTGGNSTGGATGTGGSGTGGATGTGGSGTGGATGTGGNTGTGGSSSGNNLVVNGDFSQGTTNWSVTGSSPPTPDVSNGQLCVTLSGTGTIYVGWGNDTVSANLMANVNYTLSYQAKSSSAVSFDVHIGQAVGSFNLDKDLGNETLGTNLAPFTQMFSLSTADPQAGVAFVLMASSGSPTVCVSDVTLTQN